MYEYGVSAFSRACVHVHAHVHAHVPRPLLTCQRIIYVQVITAWGAYISVHLIMLLAIYLLAPNDFVQMYSISP